MSIPSCTVVIATYNSDKTLEKCLVSVFEQTYRPEVIIIDGGSTDDTQLIIGNFIGKIAYFISEPDRGVYDAWNKGLERVTGEWVTFIGSDDYFSDPDSLSRGLAFAEKDASLGLVYPRINLVDGAGNFVELENYPIRDIRSRLRKKMPFTHCGSLHKMSTFAELGKFNPNFRIAGDYEFVLRLSKENAIGFCEQYLISMGNEGLSRTPKTKIILLNEMLAAREKNNIQGKLLYDIYVHMKIIIFKVSAFFEKFKS
ncbi:glycosyltransferase family 2 protein [Janthinobacterium tructae]